MNYFHNFKTNRSSKVWYTVDCGNITVLAINGTSKPEGSPPCWCLARTAYVDSFCCPLVTQQDYWPSCWTCLNYMQGELEGFISSCNFNYFCGEMMVQRKQESWLSHQSWWVEATLLNRQVIKGEPKCVTVCFSWGEWLYQLLFLPSSQIRENGWLFL